MTTSMEAEEQAAADGGGGDTGTGNAPAPAYSSYSGFKSMLDQLRDEGVPTVFDRSYFGTKSGGLIAQIRGTLRFFVLIDSDYKPTPLLHELVNADPDRRTVMIRELLEAHYPEELALSRRRGTYGQLAALFKERRLTGATASKAATFLVHAMNDVGFEVSPYFTQGRPSSNAAGSRSRKRKATAPSPEPTPAPAPAPAVPSVSDKRIEYIDMLMELARNQQTDTVQLDLLDRLERALGYEEAAKE